MKNLVEALKAKKEEMAKTQQAIERMDEERLSMINQLNSAGLNDDGNELDIEFLGWAGDRLALDGQYYFNVDGVEHIILVGKKFDDPSDYGYSYDYEAIEPASYSLLERLKSMALFEINNHPIKRYDPMGMFRGIEYKYYDL